MAPILEFRTALGLAGIQNSIDVLYCLYNPSWPQTGEIGFRPKVAKRWYIELPVSDDDSHDDGQPPLSRS